MSTPEAAWKNIIIAFRNKLGKAEKYRQGFQCIGVAIIIDLPLSTIDDPQWGKRLSDIADDSYDFVALIHWTGVKIYDFKTGEYLCQEISEEDMNALNSLGRMAAEGIIKDDDPVWS